MNKIQLRSTLFAILSALALVSSGCASKPSTFSEKSTRPTAKRARPAKLLAVRDPVVRSEIEEELGDLSKLTEARENLRETFKASPLLGPLTVAHLDQVLVAEYRAQAMERDFARKATLAEQQPSTGGQAREELMKVASPPNGMPAALIPGMNRALPNSDQVGTAVAMHTGLNGSIPAGSPAGVPTPIQTGLSTASNADPNVDVENSSVVTTPISGTEPGLIVSPSEPPLVTLKKLSALENSAVELSNSSETPLIFDIPVTYNERVSRWIHFFQTTGRSSFHRWLERSSRFLPMLQYELTRAGLPQDLVYVAMIESGFTHSAQSHMGAVGLWQFIKPTGQRYGLNIDWWIDERRDFAKSTRAAISYMTDLYQQFGSWYLVAASYNMGEGGVRRLIARHKTNNFWELADKRALPRETTDYVPKIIAAMLISKAPALYGFRDLTYNMPLSYESMKVPGGTDLINLANYLGVSEKYLKDLNPELLKGFVPRDIKGHSIRVPKGSMMTVSQFIRLQGRENATN